MYQNLYKPYVHVCICNIYNTYVSVYDLVGFLMKYVSVMSGNNSNIFPPNTVLVNSNEEVH